MTVDTPLADLGRYGKGLASRFRRLGIRTVGDLLYHAPLRYEDLSALATIAEARVGETVTIRATVELIANRRSPVKRTVLTEAILDDGTGKMAAVWFKQPYLTKVLRPGMRAAFAGKVSDDYGTLHLVNPVYEAGERSVHTGRLVPLYPTTASLTQKHIRALIHQALPALASVPDPLPDAVARAHGLPPLAAALRELHMPTASDALAAARRRLLFDGLLIDQLVAQRVRAAVRSAEAVAVPFNEAETKRVVAGLPFTLTDDQRRAAWVILRDMAGQEPMHRLLDGDVGSGKTVVAAIAAVNAAAAGAQAAFMAPTEILAKQHYETMRAIIPGREVALRTNAYREGDDRAPIVVGTHALLEDEVRLPHLALAVVDEQHRFGVEQRKGLQRKREDGRLPHLLSMTATPIPRTLQLARYGDLDVSVLRTKPSGRLPIITRVARESERAAVYGAVRTELEGGHQAFVVCPVIEPSDVHGARSATEVHAKLAKEVFPDRTVGLLHGRLKSKEKEAVMVDFLKQKIAVLVATAVVEVGIDVPNASVMVIEGAERFGLAQLHQFRGRVGRGSAQSYCYAVSESGMVPRLRAFAECADGFELAERDLALRGPGERFGVRQSGAEDLYAGAVDLTLLAKVQEAAKALIAADPTLAGHPALLERVTRAEDRIHLE